MQSKNQFPILIARWLRFNVGGGGKRRTKNAINKP